MDTACNTCSIDLSAEPTYKVSEIFYSIEGEGKRAGLPCLFIRFHGCNLCCSYCDSTYACYGDEGIDYELLTKSEIMERIMPYLHNAKVRYVTLTGGEPLMQEYIAAVISDLTDAGFEVNIETNGTRPIAAYKNISNNVFITMDWKTKSSGHETAMDIENLSCLGRNDVLKFVVGNQRDLEDMELILRVSDVKAQIYVSPIFGQIELTDIANFLIANHLHNVRMQLQMHKYIWDPNARGV